VPYVIQVDPNLQVQDRYGSVDSVPVLAQPDVPDSVIAQLPGAIQDRSFYAQVQGMPAARHARVVPVGLCLALNGKVGFVSIILPWPLAGAILAGCVVIAILVPALPAWFQFRPRRRYFQP
jgi:hypothetical protein